jgi:hypothetical protein
MELWEHIRIILGENLVAAAESDGIRVKYMDVAAREAAKQCEDMTVRFAATFADASLSEQDMRELFQIFIKHNYGKE